MYYYIHCICLILRYTVVAGTPEKMIEHLLEIGTDKARQDDGKLAEFVKPVLK